jgi:chromosomal replication initiation ATPase DnaA
LNGGKNVDASTIWTEALEKIRTKLSRASFDTWFANTTAELDGKTLIICCPNRFSTEWNHARYSKLILETIDELTGNMNITIAFKSMEGVPLDNGYTNDRTRIIQ